MSVICGDSLHVLPTLDAESVDAIVCDPPYGLSFMGKDWDHGVPGEAFWREAWRVAKPGAHLVAFGGTRTYHRLAVAIEDAGWEIRDCLSWLYGSGFPKSHDVSKAIDKRRDDWDDIAAVVRWLEHRRRESGVTRHQVEQHFGTQNIGQALFTVTPRSTPRIADWKQWTQLKALIGFGNQMDAEVWRLNGRKGKPGDAFAEREVVGSKAAGMGSGKTFGMLQAEGDNANSQKEVNVTAPATDLAREWQGWGTALKPAWEPIILARKPLIGTVAANVTQYGTGALNVDGCRIEGAMDGVWGASNATTSPTFNGSPTHTEYRSQQHPAGRWPANVCLDEEAAGMLDAMTGKLKERAVCQNNRGATTGKGLGYGSTSLQQTVVVGYGDAGGASRFFYTAKASRREREAGLEGMPEHKRDESREHGQARTDNAYNRGATAVVNSHPTVKPIALMRWLCRLVTPKSGLILDPFTGSGTTGCAAVLEGFRFVGVEREPEYVAIAEARIAHWSAQTPDADLFTEAR